MSTTPPTPGAAPSRTYTPSAEVEAVLDASFAAYGIVACVHCGRMAAQGYCAPCEGKNSPPLHGYVPPVACSKNDCDELETWNTKLLAENTALKRAIEAQAAAVRAGKGGNQ